MSYCFTSGEGPAPIGLPCSIPFTYEGQLYSSCASLQNSRPIGFTIEPGEEYPSEWCSVVDKYNETVKDSWGFCSSCVEVDLFSQVPQNSEQKFTLSGCPCKQTWKLPGHEPCRSSCCLPGTDDDNAWCLTQDPTCETTGWGYCREVQDTFESGLSEVNWLDDVTLLSDLTNSPASGIQPSANTANPSSSGTGSPPSAVTSSPTNANSSTQTPSKTSSAPATTPQPQQTTPPSQTPTLNSAPTVAVQNNEASVIAVAVVLVLVFLVAMVVAAIKFGAIQKRGKQSVGKLDDPDQAQQSGDENEKQTSDSDKADSTTQGQRFQLSAISHSLQKSWDKLLRFGRTTNPDDSRAERVPEVGDGTTSPKYATLQKVKPEVKVTKGANEEIATEEKSTAEKSETVGPISSGTTEAT